MGLLRTIVILSLLVVVAHAIHCETDPSIKDSNKFLAFFDKCLYDNSKVHFLGDFSVQLQEWFNLYTYPVYVLVGVWVITLYFFSDNLSHDDNARGNCFRLEGYVFLMRIGVAISMIPWLWAIIAQKRTCVCTISDDGKGPLVPWYLFNEWGVSWGMPSDSSFTATIVGLHFATLVNVPLGLLFVIVMSATGLFTGAYSLGQVIVGCLFGVFIHFYTTRTPIFMRFADVVFSLIAGIVALFIQKAMYEDENFQFAILFLIGIAWQLFGLVLMFVSYDWEFLRAAMRRSAHNLHHVDFLYYKPLNAPPSEIGQNKYPHEAKWMTVVTLVFFAILGGLRVAQKYMDKILWV